MAKDPAFLFYPGDWLGGTQTFSRFLKGCYMDVLMAQFNSGHLSLEEIKTVLGSDFGQAWPTIQKKFKTDSYGLFFNERLELEKERRLQFTQSRANNRKKKEHIKNISISYDKTYVKHMENENRNENIIDLEKGVQGEKPAAWDAAFDERTLESYRMRYKFVNLQNELHDFLLKCQADRHDYYRRDAAGLRKAFLYQLKFSKPEKQHGIAKIITDTAQRNALIAARFAATGTE